MNESEASKKTAISPKRHENYSDWYQEVIKAADLADHSPVRGAMVIKPWGYGIWENIQKVLDRKFKETGHENAYFPLLIPLSLLEKEAQHVEGFAKECAVVTHHRLEAKGGKLVPCSPLDEPLIIRPTSETIIGEMFSSWVQSWRDLPLLINQWANIVRWELRTRMFLRTSEILWQEGHTVHATAEEAMEETLRMLNVYNQFARDYLAVPPVMGIKIEAEKFPGADRTYTIEMMMQDRKALQGGTSHFLGQNFAKASEIKFCDQAGQQQYAWTTSWGMTTRTIGAVIMTHGDDNGLVLPPKIAPLQVVIVPIIHKEEQKEKILSYCNQLKIGLLKQRLDDSPLLVKIDERDMRGGEKGWQWIKKGVPLRIEVGLKEVEASKVSYFRRDQDPKARLELPMQQFIDEASGILESMQALLLKKAEDYRKQNTHYITSKEDFYKFFTPQDGEQPEIHGGFALSHIDEDPVLLDMIQKDLGVTARCIPLDMEQEEGACILSGRKCKRRVLFAKAY